MRATRTIRYEVRSKIVCKLLETENGKSCWTMLQRVEQGRSRRWKLTRVKRVHEQGSRDALEVTRAENVLLNAQTQFIGLKMDYAIQLAQIDLAIGKPTGRVDMRRANGRAAA